MKIGSDVSKLSKLLWREAGIWDSAEALENSISKWLSDNKKVIKDV